MIASNREAEDKAAELLAELEATRASMRLLAKSKGIKPAELDDYLLAVEITEDQLQDKNDEANGEQLDTAPSGSSARPQPVLRPVKKKSSTPASGAKPAPKPAPKSDRIPKLAAATPKPGPK